MSVVEDFVLSTLPALLRKMKSGGTPDTSRDNYYGGSIPFVAIDDMTSSNKYIEKSRKTLSAEGLKSSNAWLVPPGAILYSIYATLGVPRINRVSVTTNQAILAMLCDETKINTDYLYYWLTYIRSSVINFSSQTTQSNLSSTIVKGFEVEHPECLPEQAKIAEVLSTVDRAIEQTEALIQKQQRIKTGLMADLLTRGIDEHGNLRSEATHAFKDSPLGRIPVEWEVVTLDSVAHMITSGSRGWAQYYSVEGARFLRIGNLTRQHINMRLEDLVFVNPPASSEGKRTGVEPGDLLISITADLGIIGVIPEGFEESYVNQHISLIRLNKKEVDPRFIGWLLNSRQGQVQFERLNESGAKAGLNLPAIGKLDVLRIDIAEQSTIAQMLDKSVKAASRFEAELQKLRSLKTALMQDLLTGKKRVTDLLDTEVAG